MKSTLIVVLLALVLGLGTICVLQSRQAAERKARITALDRALENRNERVQELEKSKELLNQQHRDLLQQAEAQSAELNRQINEAPPSALTPSAPAGQPNQAGRSTDSPGFGNLFSKMMSDPDTKKFIRAQQGMMMEQLYAPLTKRMGLTAEETTKFNELMVETAMKGAEKATTLMGGTNRTEAIGAIAADSRAADEQMKEFLGETRYAQYKDYQQTAGERMQLSLFKQQFGGADMALTEAQTEQLLGFMKEEKQSLAAVAQPVPGMGQDAANMELMLSEDRAETLLQSQEYLNDRVRERAKEILSPEQLNAFARFQTNQLQAMRMGVGMVRKILEPSGEPNAAPAIPASP